MATVLDPRVIVARRDFSEIDPSVDYFFVASVSSSRTRSGTSSKSGSTFWPDKAACRRFPPPMPRSVEPLRSRITPPANSPGTSIFSALNHPIPQLPSIREPHLDALVAQRLDVEQLSFSGGRSSDRTRALARWDRTIGPPRADCALGSGAGCSAPSRARPPRTGQRDGTPGTRVRRIAPRRP